MSIAIDVSDDIKNLVNDIIKKLKLDAHAVIKYSAGSEVGDGYMSKTVAVDIDGASKSISLFLKYALNAKVSLRELFLDKIYFNEIYFYDVIYPAYLNFVKDRGVVDGFRHIPICYGTSSKNILALENLKPRGYTLFDRQKLMNDDHILVVFKAYAKYHAISLAYKDQDREEYEKLNGQIMSIFNNSSEESNQFFEMQRHLINGFVNGLDSERDKHILDRIENLDNKLLDYLQKCDNLKYEYSVLSKGDCWSNNIMFLYADENMETPVDVMLIDWQMIRSGPLVWDLSYFFYTAASKEKLNNLGYYLKAYHDELCINIKKLGSDSKSLYPYSVLVNEWKEHCKLGYLMAFMIIRVMLISKEDVPNLETIDMEKFSTTVDPFPVKNSNEYIRRMVMLTEHVIENDFL